MFPTMSDPREKRIARFGFRPEIVQKILKAKRCFIIGMGPSLAKIDPDAIRNELVIGVNFVLKTHIKPDIICISDPVRVDPLLNASSPKVITVRHVYREKSDILAGADTYYDIDFVPLNKANVLAISEYPSDLNKIYCGGTVIGDLCMPLASYLGLKEAYILGMDGFAAGFPKTHAWGHDRTSPVTDEAWLRGTARLNERAARLATQAGCAVFNATTGGSVTAFRRVDLNKLLPQIVRTRPGIDVSGRHFVFHGDILTAVPSEQFPGSFSLVNEETGKIIRHRGGLVFQDVPADTEIFRKDSSFMAEPSFVNQDWISFRSCNVKDAYITALDERSPYILRGLDRVFSAYFSSFRPFDTKQKALSRVNTDQMLMKLEEMRRAIGNVMLEQDAQ